MKRKIFKFLQENYGWIVALITGISISISFVLRFINYIYSKLYFNYYGISYRLFKSEQLGVLYNFGLSIILIGCLYSLFYCYKQIFDGLKNKKINNILLKDIAIIIVSNIFISLSSEHNSNKQLIVLFIVLVIIEIIISFCIFKSIKKENKNENIVDSLKVLPFYLLIIIFCFSINYSFSIANNKTFNIINNDKVIVYETSDYYVVLDCSINKDKLIIYKGMQTKINNENVKSTLKKFKEVKLK